MSEEPISTEEALRGRALRQLKKQRDFRIHLAIYVMVNGLLVAIWALNGAGYFWPVFILLGWGIGIVANGWDAYGRDVPSEEQIEREMQRLRGKQ